jgi:hypothetical protein
VTKCHRLVAKRVENLGDTPSVDVDPVPENEGYLFVLQEVSKVFGPRDLTEEFVAYGCFPVRGGWSVSAWALEEKWADGVPVPNFAEAFQLRKERK